MKGVTRRGFLGAVTAAGASLGLTPKMLADLRSVLRMRSSRPPVIWLQGQGCSGCSVSLLNTIRYATADALLTETIDLEFHPTLMASAGEVAVSAAEAAQLAGGYVLAVEGAIPTGEAGEYCHLWPGTTMVDAVEAFAENAAYILAIGTCAAYGGIPAGAPNPTGAHGVQQVLGAMPNLVNIPGCPTHPDWIVGTIAHILATGSPPPLDTFKRPMMFFGSRVHDTCAFKRLKYCGQRIMADELGDYGCLEDLGCKGKTTYADCPVRKWNSGTPNKHGDSWCIGAGSPCHGCTEFSFPDGKSPFFSGVGE